MKTMKKTLSVILVVVMLLTSAPLQGFVGLEWPEISFGKMNLQQNNGLKKIADQLSEFADSFSFNAKAAEYTSDIYTYSISSNKATITKVDASAAGDLVIPDVLGEYPVVSIAANAFASKNNITSIVIPASVKSIGAYAFSRCDNLASVKFSDNSQLTGLDNLVFESCASLVQVDFGNNSLLTKLSERTFLSCAVLENVDFGDNSQLKTIGNYAFCGCKLLPAIVIPDSVTSIGEAAFKDCKALASVTFGENSQLINIWNSAFNGCVALSSIAIPDSVTNIKGAAFYNCSALTEVVFGENSQLQTIGDYAFEDCALLPSIIIPAGVTNLATTAFRDCSLFAGVMVHEDNETYSSLDGVLYNKDQSELIKYFEGKTNSVFTVPDSVQSIQASAFTECKNLASVEFSDNSQLTSIGNSAFYNCSSMTSISFGSNSLLTSIGNYAFFGCKLTSITLPAGVTSIGEHAFDHCKLTSVFATDAVSWLGINFNNASCTPLRDGCNLYFGEELVTELVIPEGVTSIGNYAFYGCKSITGITMPDGLTNIGERAFVNCSSLTTVMFGENSQLTSIGEYAFSNCKKIESVYASDAESWLGINFANLYSNPLIYGCDLYFGEELATELVIPEGVTSVGNYAFYGCKSITSITIPDSLTNIEKQAFENCSSLTTVMFGENSKLTSIGGYAFMGCSALTDITIPDGVTSIGGAAFSGCSALTDITIPAGVTSIGSGTFSGCTKLTNVYAADIESWSGIKFGDIRSNPLNQGGTLYFGETPVTDIVIPEGVTTINDYAFYGCNNITTIAIPDSVTSIGQYVFYDCISLTAVAFGENSQLTSIGVRAFYGCSSMTDITIPAGVTDIGEYAFCNCSSLPEIILPDNVTKIDYRTFRKCTSLQTVVLPIHLTSISSEAFFGCSSLISIDIPEDVTSIGGNAFSGCTALQRAIINLNASIVSGAFSNCPVLTIYGVAGSKAEIYAIEHSIPFELLGNTLLLTLADEDGNSFKDGFTVCWYDAQGNAVGAGAFLSNVTIGETYSYEVELGEDLAKEYKIPENGSVTIEADVTEAVCNLEKLPLCSIKGTVKDIENNNLAGAAVTITQIFVEKYINTIELTTDENGQFAISLPETATTISYASDGYYSRTRKVTLDAEKELDLSTVLTQLPDNKITLSLKVKYAVADGDEERVYDLTSADNLSFTLYDITQDKEITGFVVQYPYIVLTDARVMPADVLEIAVVDTANTMKAENVKVILDESTKGSAEIVFTQNGKIAVYNLTGAEKINVLVFDDNGQYVESEIVTATPHRAYAGGILPDGNYQVVLIKNTSLLKKVSALSALDSFGFVAGTDYVLEQIAVKNGEVSKLQDIVVPDFDESKFYYTVAENTAFIASDASAVTGKYLTMKLSYEIDSKYASSDQVVTVTFPEGISFVNGSLTVDGKRAPYVYENGVLTVNTNKAAAVLRFYVVATAAGTHSVNAALQFNNGGTVTAQPLSTATFDAINSRMSVPEKSAEKTVYTSGTALPGSTVKVIDNGVEVGTTTANKNGSWSLKIDLVDAYSYSNHAIYAEITTKGIEGVTETDVEILEYNINYIDLSTITMVWNLGKIVYDFRTDSTQIPSVVVNNGSVFTFMVDFTENDPERIEDVVVHVTTLNGDNVLVDCVYDEIKGCWIGSAVLRTNAPVSVTASYSVKDEDKITIDNDMRDAGLENLASLKNSIAEAVEYGELEYEDISFADIAEVYGDEYISRFENSESIILFTRLMKYSMNTEAFSGTGYTLCSTEIVSDYDTSDSVHCTNEDGIDLYYMYEMTKAGLKLSLYNAETHELSSVKSSSDIKSLLFEDDNTSSQIPVSDSGATDIDAITCFMGLSIGLSNFETRTRAAIETALLIAIVLFFIGRASYIAGSIYDGNLNEKFNELEKDMKENPQCYKGMEDEIDNLRKTIDGWTSNGKTAFDLMWQVASPFTGYIGAVGGIGYDIFSWINRKIIDNKIRDIKKRVPDLGGNNSNPCKDLPPDSPYDPKNSDVIVDPSGYVYEAVPSNRVEGVKVEAYCYDYPLDEFGMPLDEKEEIFWDASEYDQVNPLYTDAEGHYAWDVPAGQWLVKYSKEGYYDTDSRNDIAADEDGYLPVPPPQVDVNTAIVSKAVPEVSSVNVYNDSIQIIFTQYMKPATVNNDTVQVLCDGVAVTGSITAVNAEYNYEETEQFASVYSFTPDAVLEGTISVSVADAVNYAGKAMANAYTTSATAEIAPESIKVPEVAAFAYNAETVVEIAVLPAGAGVNKAITVTSENSDRVQVVTENVTTDENGKAKITLKGNLPGACQIFVSLDGTDIRTAFVADVGNVVAEKIKCEKVTANITNGSVVEAGTEIILSTTTEGAEIYYTLDGTCPCVLGSASRLLYEGPIVITEDTFIIAYAVKADCEDSATAGFVYTIAPSSADEYILGDVDLNGDVDSSDARLALRAAVKLEKLDELQTKAADADKDGEISSSDARLILRAAVGLEILQ